MDDYKFYPNPNEQEPDTTSAGTQDLFAAAFHCAAIGMALIGADAQSLQVNRSFCDFLGYAAEELNPLDIQAVTHPDDWQTDLELFQRVLAGEIDSYQIEKRYIHKHGHSIWGLLTVSVARDEKGDPLYYISQIQDISERKALQEKLQRQKNEFESLLNNSPNVISRVDREHRHLYVNRTIERVSHVTAEDFIGRKPEELRLPAGYAKFWNDKFAQAFATGEEVEMEFSFPGDDGLHWVHGRVVPERDENDEIVSLLAVTSNVTSLKQIEAERARLNTILEESPDLVAFADPEGRLLYINRAGRSLLGFSEEADCKRATLFDIYPDWMTSRIQNVVLPMARLDGSWIGEAAMVDHQKRQIPSLQTIIAHKDRVGQVEYLSIVARNISLLKESQAPLEATQSELQQANAELEKLAHQDGLTGAKNRRAFDERLPPQIEKAKTTTEPFSLVILDIDDFKSYNDSYGHPAGDEVLRQIARLLQNTVAPTDMVARYGGEEFVLVLCHTEEDTGATLAEKCRVAIEQHRWPRRNITASFGVAQWSGEDAQTLLVRADLALYEAKQAGKNCVKWTG